MMHNPATPRQTTYALDLAEVRKWEMLPSDFQQALATIESGAVSKQEASILIDLLKRCPMRKETPRVEPGYYVKDNRVYVVVQNRAGTGTYAKEMVVTKGRGRWVYVKGAVHGLVGMEPLTVAMAARLGRHHGACMICGRPLTDKESVAKGIGPVCASKIGA